MTGFDSKRAAAAGKNDWRCSHGWLRGEQCEICNAPKPAQEPWMPHAECDTPGLCGHARVCTGVGSSKRVCGSKAPEQSAQEDEEVCSHCGSYCHERDELDKAEREIVRLQKLVAQEPVGQTICNTCNGTGVVRNLHDWTTGKKREQKCWNCHAPAAQPAQEPVAWMWKDMRGQDVVSLFEPRLNSIPLYTIPTLPSQEPTTIHQFRSPRCVNWYDGFPDHHDGGGPYEVRTLYATPPQRPWVGLTNEEIKAMDAGATSNSSFYAGALWAEAKLEEKNNG